MYTRLVFKGSGASLSVLANTLHEENVLLCREILIDQETKIVSSLYLASLSTSPTEGSDQYSVLVDPGRAIVVRVADVCEKIKTSWSLSNETFLITKELRTHDR